MISLAKCLSAPLRKGERPEGVDAYNAERKVKVYDNGEADAVGRDRGRRFSETLSSTTPTNTAIRPATITSKWLYLYDVRFNLASRTT